VPRNPERCGRTGARLDPVSCLYAETPKGAFDASRIREERRPDSGFRGQVDQAPPGTSAFVYPYLGNTPVTERDATHD
jgi:hypothetical protein